VAATTADPQRRLGCLGDELVLDPGTLHGEPLVETLAHLVCTGQQIALVEADQPLQFLCIGDGADAANLPQVKRDGATQFDFGSICIEQFESEFCFEVAGVQKCLPQIGQGLFGLCSQTRSASVARRVRSLNSK